MSRSKCGVCEQDIRWNSVYSFWEHLATDAESESHLALDADAPTPQLDAYRAKLEELQVAEQRCRRIPTIAALNEVLALRAEADTIRGTVPPLARPVLLGRFPQPAGLSPRRLPSRRTRHSDWGPMSWRGADN